MCEVDVVLPGGRMLRRAARTPLGSARDEAALIEAALIESALWSTRTPRA